MNGKDPPTPNSTTNAQQSTAKPKTQTPTETEAAGRRRASKARSWQEPDGQGGMDAAANEQGSTNTGPDP